MPAVLHTAQHILFETYVSEPFLAFLLRLLLCVPRPSRVPEPHGLTSCPPFADTALERMSAPPSYPVFSPPPPPMLPPMLPPMQPPPPPPGGPSTSLPYESSATYVGAAASESIGRSAGVSDAVRMLIRTLAPVLIGLGVMCMVSGGPCVVSSALVIAQGAVWLSATATLPEFERVVAAMKTMSISSCAASGKLAVLRNLAISGIVFASIELLVGFSIGVGVGLFTGSLYQKSLFPSLQRDFNGFIIQPPSCILRFNDNFWLRISSYFFYFAGNAVVAGAVNVTLSVVTLQLLPVVDKLTTPPPKEHANPLAIASSPSGTRNAWEAAV